MIKGILVFNKFYFDDGMQYMKSRIQEEFAYKNVELKSVKAYALFDIAADLNLKDVSFAIFLDKDAALARYFQRLGIRVFNSPDTLSACDDKELTYSVLSGVPSINLAKTISSPLMYDVNDDGGGEFLKLVTKNLKFPIVVKEAVGSQGRQVYLAEDSNALSTLYSKLKHTKHLYQEFVGKNKGEDIRVYIVGKKAIGAAKRKNTTDFRSNVSAGGSLEIIELEKKIKDSAEKAAQTLNLEYGSVDFILDKNSDAVLIEVNSNVYFKTCESKGLEIAKKLVNYILSEIDG